MTSTLKNLLANPIVERAYKTAVETGIAAAATTTVVSTSTVEKVLVTAGATFLSVLWNGLVSAYETRKGVKLTALQTAIDAAVNSKLVAASTIPEVPPTA